MPEDLLERTPPKADYRLKYGPLDLQFGDLRLPAAVAGQAAPVVVFLHGGWWKAKYGLDYGGHLCDALKHRGIATWSLEYRRVGDAGGGWPGTFLDVAAGFDALAGLAAKYRLDLSRVVVAGHSAGGHLAFWLAGRHHLAAHGELAPASTPKVAIKGVVGLAGAVDLRLVIELAGWFTYAHDKDEVIALMGGSPAKVPDRYTAGNPGDLIPLNVPQWLLQGTEDDQIPPALPGRWAERGRRAGEKVVVEMLAGADHFDVVDPRSKAWPAVLRTIEQALR